MRAFRAVALFGMIASAWIGWRAAIVSQDLNAALTVPDVRFASQPPPATEVAPDAFGWEQPPATEAPHAEAVLPVAPGAMPMPPQTVQVLWLPPPPAPATQPAPAANGRAASEIVFLDGPGTAPARDPPAPAATAAASAPPPSPPTMMEQAWREASLAYTMLGAGDRAGAAEAFRLALSMAPDHPNAPLWVAERKRLTRRWRVETYAFLRPEGTPSLPAGTPVLGSGSVAAFVGYGIKPTARRPVEVFGRLYAGSGLDGAASAETQQAAVGLNWRPLPGIPVTLSAERLIAIGAFARNDWSFRLSGGHVERWRGITLEGYGEAGVIGTRPDWFVGGQATATRPIALPLGLELSPGAGVWGATQTAGGLGSSRLDIGPTLKLRGGRKLPVMLSADYRFQVSGNALPGDSAAITIATAF